FTSDNCYSGQQSRSAITSHLAGLGAVWRVPPRRGVGNPEDAKAMKLTFCTACGVTGAQSSSLASACSRWFGRRDEPNNALPLMPRPHARRRLVERTVLVERS